MEHILLPNIIEVTPTDKPNVGTVVISPCQQGYGITLANALRRVLLSSLPGAAVESVKIKGVQHEFSAIDGVKEDVVEVIMNLKQLAVRCHSDEPVVLTLKKKGAGPVTASDFSKNADVEIANPEEYIATITDDKFELDMEVTVGKGFGYLPVSEKDTKSLDLGTIAIDALYTPIRDVGYTIDMTRVGDVTDYEKLTLTVETNGTITTSEALAQATKILMDYFSRILENAHNQGSAATPIMDDAIEVSEVEAAAQEDNNEEAKDN